MVITIRTQIPHALQYKINKFLRTEEAAAKKMGAAFTVGESTFRTNYVVIKIRFTKQSNKKGEFYTAEDLAKRLEMLGARTTVTGKL